VANLPYNLATPLVLRTLVEVPAIERLLVMVQREVGERMAAGGG
jgi:16S rRNA (adenine1518-N6/adenine1519-N6)-dimethyltransferase